MQAKNCAQPLTITSPGPNLDLFCVQQSNAAPFCKNYAKLYFDAKPLEKGLNSASCRLDNSYNMNLLIIINFFTSSGLVCY